MPFHARSILFLCLLVPETTFAQGRIIGSVQDSIATPVSFCALGLYRQGDSSLAKGCLSAESGLYVFENLAPGNYFIRIKHPGYREFLSASIHADSSGTAEQQPFILKSESLVLSEVGILGIKTPLEFANGNIIMNVENSPLTAGNSAFDLLARLPGVMADNESISIQGKSGVRFYQDDRLQPFSGPQLINFLKGLPASSVEKIEVILHPSARYDAAGNAGIINLRSKKIKITGSSGSANISYSQGYYAQLNSGFSYNYKGKKAAVFSSINGSREPRYYVSQFDKSIFYAGDTTRYNQQGRETYVSHQLTVQLGADWYPDKKTILGAKLQVMPGFASTRYRSLTVINDSMQQHSQKTTANNWTMNNYNLNAERQLDTNGGKLSLSADYYGPYLDSNHNLYANQMSGAGASSAANTDFKSDNTVSTEIFTVRSDLDKKWKGVQIGTGAKASSQAVTSNYLLARTDPLSGRFKTDSGYTNTFSYLEKITAAYLDLGKKFRKTDIQLGLRVENTQVTARLAHDTVGYTRRYTSLFPNLSIGHQFSAKHRLHISYDKRIGRPDYNSFNPYTSFTNIFFSKTGNPYLQPAFTHNLNLSHVLNNSIYNNISFSATNNLIANYVSQNDSSAESILRVTNLNRQYFLQYSFFLRKTIVPWWVLSLSLSAYYISYNGSFDGLSYSASRMPHYEWLNSVFILPKQFRIEATAFYWGPWLATGSRFSARGGLTLGLKKVLNNYPLTCSVSLTDIFFTENWRSRSDFETQSWNYFGSNDTRRFNISLNYTFGKIKAAQHYETKDSEEQKRLKK